MDLPDIVVKPRDREFRKWDRAHREEIVMKYLFEGLSSRDLDESVLGLDPTKSRGYPSWNILGHYGLLPEENKSEGFKGIFAGCSPDEALELIPPDPQYTFLYEIISETTVNEISLEPHEWVRGWTKQRLVNVRVNQDRFRKDVLNAYGGSCCITGIKEPRLLRASHIKP